MEFFNKSTTCCFTGHRPQKLPVSMKEAKALLCSAIENAINKGFTTFISGMAAGIDIWAAEIVLEYKSLYPSVRLICALPYPGFNRGNTVEGKLLYDKILSAADFVHTACRSYSPLAYQMRNMWMVDHSSLVIAFFTGESGGTKNTIDYASSRGCQILSILK